MKCTSMLIGLFTSVILNAQPLKITHLQGNSIVTIDPAYTAIYTGLQYNATYTNASCVMSLGSNQYQVSNSTLCPVEFKFSETPVFNTTPAGCVLNTTPFLNNPSVLADQYLQNTIDCININGGGTLLLPAGDYYMQKIRVYPGVRLKGTAGTRFFQTQPAVGAQTSMIEVLISASGTIPATIPPVQIEGITFMGLTGTVTATDLDGFIKFDRPTVLNNTKRLKGFVTNCVFKNCNMNLVVQKVNTDVTLQNIEYHDCFGNLLVSAGGNNRTRIENCGVDAINNKLCGGLKFYNGFGAYNSTNGLDYNQEVYINNIYIAGNSASYFNGAGTGGQGNFLVSYSNPATETKFFTYNMKFGYANSFEVNSGKAIVFIDGGYFNFYNLARLKNCECIGFRYFTFRNRYKTINCRNGIFMENPAAGGIPKMNVGFKYCLITTDVPAVNQANNNRAFGFGMDANLYNSANIAVMQDATNFSNFSAGLDFLYSNQFNSANSICMNATTAADNPDWSGLYQSGTTAFNNMPCYLAGKLNRNFLNQPHGYYFHQTNTTFRTSGNTASADENNGVKESEPVGGQLQVYPNPVQNLLYIDAGSYTDKNNSVSGSLTAEIWDLSGKRLLTTSLAGNSIKKVDVSGLKPGVYMCLLKDKSELKAKVRFVK